MTQRSRISARRTRAGFLGAITGEPIAPVRLLSTDLSTVTTAADLVFGAGEPLREVVHVDSQAGPDADLQGNVLV